MPFATKSANRLGEFEGDLQTHIFYINTDPDANMFTAAGDFVALDDNGKAAVTLDFACKRCHLTTDINELARFAKNFHDQNLDEIGLNAGLTGTWWDSSRSGEGFVLEFGYSNEVLTLFASFYTYDDMGNLVWLTAQSTAINGTVVTVDVYITSGTMWGADFDPDDVVRTLWGTGTFSFPGCEAGTVSLMPNAGMMAMGYTDLIYGLTRDAIVSGIACPTPTAN